MSKIFVVYPTDKITPETPFEMFSSEDKAKKYAMRHGGVIVEEEATEDLVEDLVKQGN